MSNPPPVKVSPRPTGRDVDEVNLPTPQLPTYSVPTTPSYSFPSSDTRSLRITKATFKYGNQEVDCVGYIKPHISYGYVEYPVKSLFADLTDANVIHTNIDNGDALKLVPPKVSIEYFDPDGFHRAEFVMEDIIILGKLTAWGLFMKKPGELSWQAALAAGKIQFWLAVAVFWVLMIVWAYKMWTHMSDMGLSFTNATQENFGDYGMIFARAAGAIAPFGATRYVMAFIAALAPVWSFCVQFAMWYFVDSQLKRRLEPGPPISLPNMPSMGSSSAGSAPKVSDAQLDAGIAAARGQPGAIGTAARILPKSVIGAFM